MSEGAPVDMNRRDVVRDPCEVGLDGAVSPGTRNSSMSKNATQGVVTSGKAAA